MKFQLISPKNIQHFKILKEDIRMSKQALFSYGTLQEGQIQRQLFGRKLKGEKDLLREYIQDEIELTQDDFSWITYPVIEHTGKKEDTVSGIVYLISDEELKISDLYEGSAYKRIQVRLDSGKEAWTYIKSPS